MIATLALGLIVFYRRISPELSRENILAYVGGLLFIGSGASIAMQMIIGLAQAPINWTAIITSIFIISPILLGILVLRIIGRDNWIENRRNGVYLILLGIIAPFLWAGLIIGPLCVILTGIYPFTDNIETE